MPRAGLSNARRRRVWRSLALGAVFLLAFVVRSLYAVSLAPSMYTTAQPGTRMSVRYHLAALDILRGEGVLWPRERDPARTGQMARPPGYSLFLAIVYASSQPSFFTVQFLQNILASLACVAVAVAGAVLIGWTAGLVAGFLAALSPQLALVAGYITADALCGVSLAFALLCLSTAYGQPARGSVWLLLAGLLIGTAVWMRPNVLLLAPVVGCVLVVAARDRRLALRAAAVLCLATASLVVPITLRNYIVFGALVPVSINGGISFLARRGRRWRGRLRREHPGQGRDGGGSRPIPEPALPRVVGRARRRLSRPRALSTRPTGDRRPPVALRARSGPSRRLHVALRHAGGAGGERPHGCDAGAGGDPGCAFAGRVRPPARRRALPCAGEMGRAAAAAARLGGSRSWCSRSFRCSWPARWCWPGGDWRRAALLFAIPVYYLCTEPLFYYEWRVATPMHFPVFLIAAAALVLPLRKLRAHSRGAAGSSA